MLIENIHKQEVAAIKLVVFGWSCQHVFCLQLKLLLLLFSFFFFTMKIDFTDILVELG